MNETREIHTVTIPVVPIAAYPVHWMNQGIRTDLIKKMDAYPWTGN